MLRSLIRYTRFILLFIYVTIGFTDPFGNFAGGRQFNAPYTAYGGFNNPYTGFNGGTL
jgi:hypothetical protein